jgi:predicted kinase
VNAGVLSPTASNDLGGLLSFAIPMKTTGSPFVFWGFEPWLLIEAPQARAPLNRRRHLQRARARSPHCPIAVSPDARILLEGRAEQKLPPRATRGEAPCMTATTDLTPLLQRLKALTPAGLQRARDALVSALAHLEESPSLEPAPRPRQAAIPRLHLVVGPVGAGKSTHALALARAQAAVRLTLDQWMAELFTPDRPHEGAMDWYLARTARCIEQIWTVTEAILEVGTHVVLEIGLIQRSDRQRFYARVDDAGYALTIHVLDASRDVRRERVTERNRARGSTFSMVVPPAIFELASDLWEPLDSSECAGRDVRFLRGAPGDD